MNYITAKTALLNAMHNLSIIHRARLLNIQIIDIPAMVNQTYYRSSGSGFGDGAMYGNGSGGKSFHDIYNRRKHEYQEHHRKNALNCISVDT